MGCTNLEELEKQIREEVQSTEIEIENIMDCIENIKKEAN